MSAGFRLIELETWPRREHYEAYFKNTPCTWSMTVQLDVTGLVKQGAKLYPALLYACGKVANRHEEFRMSLDEAASGRLIMKTLRIILPPICATWRAGARRRALSPSRTCRKTSITPRCCPGRASRVSI